MDAELKEELRGADLAAENAGAQPMGEPTSADRATERAVATKWASSCAQTAQQSA